MTAQAPDPEDGMIRSARFRAARQAGWTRLDALVMVVERRGLRALSFAEARELSALYRHAMNSLSTAREITLDAALLVYLEALCARGYLAVYAPQDTLGGLVSRFFRIGAPHAVRACAGHIAVSMGLLLIGAIAGYGLFMEHSAWYDVLVGVDARGPGASTDTLRRQLYDGASDPLGELAAFASYLFNINATLAIFAFALGVFACAPTVALLVYNGLSLGAFVALFVDRGLGPDIFGWLSIHGVTELSAICIAAAGGLRLGNAVLFPGRRTRGEALRRAGGDAGKLAVVAAMMLVVAAVLEGFGRQLVTSQEARVAIGWGTGALWLAWFALAGRRA
ncbi:MAG: putative membrane protein SpoIIM required for sporulation [Paracoccaceae bacterium]|jgi:uncharacterized membrane protein SpoIIM required for sporulation